ncbi:MAG: hemerythrin domain-containing protein [Ilumatobacteraceae bacterium]
MSTTTITHDIAPDALAAGLPDAVLGSCAVHLGLRSETARIAEHLDAGRVEDARRRARLLARVLAEHHRAEDELLWPALVRRQPGIVATTDAREAEHEPLDDELAELIDDPQRIERVGPLLDGHLRAEAATMLPVWRASFDAAEHERFGHLLRRTTPGASVGLMVSWLIDVTPDSLRPFALGRLPRAFRMAHQMCRRPSFDRRYG